MKMTSYCKCTRCGYEWIPSNKKVLRCARCLSPYWDLPRTNKYEKN